MYVSWLSGHQKLAFLFLKLLLFGLWTFTDAYLLFCCLKCKNVHLHGLCALIAEVYYLMAMHYMIISYY